VGFARQVTIGILLNYEQNKSSRYPSLKLSALAPDKMQRERNFYDTKSLFSRIVVTEFVAEATSPVKEWHDLCHKQNKT